MSDRELIVKIGTIAFRLEGDFKGFHADLTCEEIAPQLHEISIQLDSDIPVTPAPFKLTWNYPINDVQAMWYPGCHAKRWLTVGCFFCYQLTTRRTVSLC